MTQKLIAELREKSKNVKAVILCSRILLLKIRNA
jgi:hypothetical protein